MSFRSRGTPNERHARRPALRGGGAARDGRARSRRRRSTISSSRSTSATIEHCAKDARRDCSNGSSDWRAVRRRIAGLRPPAEARVNRFQGRDARHPAQGQQAGCSIISTSRFGDFCSPCRMLGLTSGLAGSLEAPDVPRLLLVRPGRARISRRALSRPRPEGGLDPHCASRCSRSHSARASRRRRSPKIDWRLLARGIIGGRDHESEVDHVFVRDFVVPAYIGAYDFERTRRSGSFSTSRSPCVARRVTPTTCAGLLLRRHSGLDPARRRARPRAVRGDLCGGGRGRPCFGMPGCEACAISVRKIDVIDGSVGVEILRERTSNGAEGNLRHRRSDATKRLGDRLRTPVRRKCAQAQKPAGSRASAETSSRHLLEEPGLGSYLTLPMASAPTPSAPRSPSGVAVGVQVESFDAKRRDRINVGGDEQVSPAAICAASRTRTPAFAAHKAISVEATIAVFVSGVDPSATAMSTPKRRLTSSGMAADAVGSVVTDESNRRALDRSDHAGRCSDDAGRAENRNCSACESDGPSSPSGSSRQPRSSRRRW